MPGFGAIGESPIGSLPDESSGGGGQPGVGLQRTFGSMAFASKVFAPGVFRGVGVAQLAESPTVFPKLRGQLNATRTLKLLTPATVTLRGKQ